MKDSEGRGEPLLKTDQDNGLILRDGYTPLAELVAVCQRFSDALAYFGYTPCPGNIMLSNPPNGDAPPATGGKPRVHQKKRAQGPFF